MNKQTLFASGFLVLIAALALWFSFSSNSSKAGQAVSKETSAPQADVSESAASENSPWTVRCNDVKKPEAEEAVAKEAAACQP